jgi:Holliday junction resolvase RusA-like endonuclease
MTAVQFEVLGHPAPQGDKSAVLIAGRPRLIEGRRTTGRQRHANWRSAVADAARDVANHDDVAAPLDGPLHVTIRFRFPMPASRPKKIRAAGQAWKTTAPDLDKVLRATFDGLTAGGLIVDDARICEVTASKIETVGWTGAEIWIEPIEHQP